MQPGRPREEAIDSYNRFFSGLETYHMNMRVLLTYQ